MGLRVLTTWISRKYTLMFSMVALRHKVTGGWHEERPGGAATSGVVCAARGRRLPGLAWTPTLPKTASSADSHYYLQLGRPATLILSRARCANEAAPRDVYGPIKRHVAAAFLIRTIHFASVRARHFATRAGGSLFCTARKWFCQERCATSSIGQQHNYSFKCWTNTTQGVPSKKYHKWQYSLRELLFGS
jgi:hypothetical protein